MEEVKGFKAFNIDATNRYGKSFTEGENYRVEGKIRFGNDGNGYHMCTALSDVYRYVRATEEDVLVAEVTGRGAHVSYDDNYYGYYDMYSFEEITIDKFLSREEIIDKMLCSPSHEVRKFLSTCRISDEEAIYFARQFRNDVEVIKVLLYYHYGFTDVYEKNKNGEDYLRLVLKNGQDNNKGSKRK
jgi:hypothetical protein